MVDQLLEEYCWPVAVFYNLLDMAALNAYTLHRALFPAHVPRHVMKHRVFLKILGMKLCEQSVLLRSIPTPNLIFDNAKRLAEPATKAGLASVAKRTRCRLPT